MNEQIGNKVSDKTYINLTPFKGFVLENFPFIEADFDAITNYQLLCKVIEYLNNVISNQNQVQDLGTDLVNAYNSLVDDVNLAINTFEEDITGDFNDLKDYVDNYFDNNFPELVNDKLDEMAEDGTLENLLDNYAHLTKSYNTYTEMIADSSTFINGLRLKTLGYYTINDGGGAEYYVNNSVIATNYQIDLENGLYLNLVDNIHIKPEQIGAYGDGVHDDTLSISNAITHFSNILFSKTYLITDTILLRSDIKIEGTQNSSIEINDDINIFNGIDVHDITIKDLKLIKQSGSNYHIEFSGYFVTIDNCILTGKNFSSSNYINGINNISTENTKLCNKIINNRITNGQVILNSTDGFLKNNIIWSSTREVTPECYAVQILADSWDVEGNQIVGGSLGGLYAVGHGTGSLFNIINNYFDGSYSLIQTGTHIVLKNNQNSTNISNNKFYNGYKNSITLDTSFYVMINNNTFFNNNRSNSNIGEIEIGDYQYGNRLSICNNMFQNVSNQSFNLINFNDTIKNSIIFHDNIIHGNYTTNYNYVYSRGFNSSGNIKDGILYQRVSGIVANLTNDRYGILFQPEIWRTSIAIESLELNDTTDTSYNVSTVNNQYFIYKAGASADVGKIITAIVKEYI